MESNDIIKDLKKLDEEISAAEKEVSELEGRFKAILEPIKDKYEISTIKELEAFVGKKKEELKKLRVVLETSYLKLKEEYKW